MAEEKIAFWHKGKLVTTTIKNVDPLKPYESVEITARLMGLHQFYWCGLCCFIL